jgi:hypothetical protein
VVEGKLTSEFRPRFSDRRCCGDLRFGIPIQLYIKFFLEVLMVLIKVLDCKKKVYIVKLSVERCDR